MCHPDHHRKFPTKIIGCVIWIQMSLEATRTPNESNQNPKPNYQVRWDPYVERKRKLRNAPSLITTLLVKRNMMKSQTQQVRWDPCWWIKKRSTKLISEYQDCHMQLWKKQNISEFKSLWKGSKIILIEKHLMPTCSRITSTTIQQKFEGDDPRIGQCGVIRVVRDFSKSTMFSLSSLLESRNCVLHLRTMLHWQRIQKKV